MIQDANKYVRILKFLSDNFGEDLPDERIKGCIEIAGSVDELEHIMSFLEKKNLIYLVAVTNFRTLEKIYCPVLTAKTQRMIMVRGIEDILSETEQLKW